jgi:hypothetical protein
MLEAAAELAAPAERAGPDKRIDYDLLWRDLFDMFVTRARPDFDTPRAGAGGDDGMPRVLRGRESPVGGGYGAVGEPDHGPDAGGVGGVSRAGQSAAF